MKSKLFAGIVTGCLLTANVTAAGDLMAADDGALADARAELRVLEGTEERMRKDYDQLRAQGRLSAGEMEDFQAYLTRLEALVEEQRSTVARLEARYTGAALETEPGSVSSTQLPEGFHRGRTDEEKVASLDSQLGTSLSDFDDMLLREQQELAEKARATGTGSQSAGTGQRGSAGLEGTGDSGGEETASEGEQGQSGEPAGGNAGGETETSKQAAGEEGGAETGREGAEGSIERPGGEGAEGAEGQEQVASTRGVENAGGRSGTSSVPPDIPDGKDDDIVARQLREAAEKEEDPELREKLWDEYRKYKSRTR